MTVDCEQIMARYNILRLNKISSGARRGLVDMVIQLDYNIMKDLLLLDATSADWANSLSIEDTAIRTETGDYEYCRDFFMSNYNSPAHKNPLATEETPANLILNETQYRISSSTIQRIDSNDKSTLSNAYAIQLTPEWWLKQPTIEEVSAYASKMKELHVVYEFEKSAVDNEKTCFKDGSNNFKNLPLNDILDVCIRSMFKKFSKNPNIPGNLIHNIGVFESDGNIDIYVALDEYPIDFCNCQNDSFVLTQGTTYEPYFLRSDAIDKLNSEHMTQVEHKFYLDRDDILTYIYRQSADMHAYFTSLDGKLNQQTMIKLFEPRLTLRGISYNYVIDVDQNKQSSQEYQNNTIYFNGDIYGHASPTKNMYNALYSIYMPNHASDIQNCRSYCGIENTQNQILLKYYDDVRYTWHNTSKSPTVEASKLNTNGERVYPYQKVEFYYPTEMQSAAKHKSNLFSVKIMNSKLDEATAEAARMEGKLTETRRILVDQIKNDIANAVRHLANTIAPANTQLFDTFFTS